jgi:hypothetical protein
VDEVQVDVVEPEALERRLERPPGLALADVLDPEFRGDEQLVARDAAGGDRAPDGLLVLVGRGGVDGAVAGGQRVADDLLGLLGGTW